MSIHFKQPATRDDFIELVEKLDLKPPVIIKPNWGTSVCFTEAEIIDWTLEAIDGDAVVVESYAGHALRRPSGRVSWGQRKGETSGGATSGS